MTSGSRRTIVVVNDQANVVGGAAKVALLSAVALARRGNQVVLYTAVGPIDPSLQNVPNLRVECLFQRDILSEPNRLRAITSGIWNRSAAAGLRKILEQFKDDSPVIHFHPWVKALSPAVFAAAQASGVPSVITLHDYFLACPTGGFFDCKTGEICKKQPLSTSCISCNCDPRNYYHKLWRVGRGFVQRDFAHCPGGCENFVAVSPFSEGVLRPFLPDKAKVTLIRCPIEVTREPAIDPGLNSDFLFVGRFSPEKGALDFAKAAVSTGLKVMFIGQGEDEQKIRSTCPQATVLGWQPTTEVLKRMRASRALVFPSRWYETQGLVPIEACALGLPVIYSDVTAITADLRDGVTGMSYRAGDSEDLARVMRLMAGDDELTRKVGAAAYEWYWSDPWTMERHTIQLEDMYDRIREAGQNERN